MNLEIKNLKKMHSPDLGLRNFSLEARPGEVISILGPNGAGKTTLIHTILDWNEKDSGKVTFFKGQNFKNHRSAILQKVGFIADDPHLIEKLSIREMIDYIKIHYIFWDESYELELLEKFQLDEKCIIKTLSRGMKTKLSMLLALSYRPDLLILDEATSGLDPRARHDVLEMLVEYCSEYNKTLIYATHLLDEVNRIATKVILLNKGEVALEASMEEIQESIFSISVDLLATLEESSYKKIVSLNDNKELIQFNQNLDSIPPSSRECLNLEEIYFALTQES
ncbi:MAG: ABC transporter ATP-binding protein [Candidatus Cloacimonetes bacterium]|nr:ABC transporter ATP-binding protein [Candidatus Cloacimonadota bacterium]